MTISRKKKKLKRILDALDKAELSTNGGKIVSTPFKLSIKLKKCSGWRTPKICGKMKYSEIIKQCLEPQIYYDDWFDWRDGLRCNKDKAYFFHKWRACCISEEEVYEINKRIKKQIAIRRAKKKLQGEESNFQRRDMSPTGYHYHTLH